MRRMHVSVVLALSALVGVVQAATVTDSFDRDVVVQTSASSPNLIGANYTIVSGEWSCSSVSPGYLNASADGFMIDTSLETVNTDGTNFTVSVKALVGSAGFHPAGLVFNYQDANNYCVMRFWAETDRSQSVIQIVQYTGGSSAVLGYLITTLEVATYYTLEVSSAGNSYRCKLSNGSTLIYSDTVTGTHTGGYAGFYRVGGKTCRFDDYSLEVVYKPTAADSFDRDVATQTSASSPNLIGTNYTIVSGSWSCNSASPGFLSADAEGVMLDTSLQTCNTGGTNFTLSAKVLTVASSSSARAGGLIFNYQDVDNYYVFRYWVVTSGSDAYIQVTKREGGLNTPLDLVNVALTAPTYCMLSVSSSGGTFNLSLSDVGTGFDGDPGGLVVYTSSIVDTTFTNGYAGFLREGSGVVRVDDYILQLTPPEQVGPFDPAVISFTAAAGSITISVENLSDSSLVDNALQATTNLVSGTWTNLYSVTGVTATNWTLPTDKNQEFFRILTSY